MLATFFRHWRRWRRSSWLRAAVEHVLIVIISCSLCDDDRRSNIDRRCRLLAGSDLGRHLGRLPSSCSWSLRPKTCAGRVDILPILSCTLSKHGLGPCSDFLGTCCHAAIWRRWWGHILLLRVSSCFHRTLLLLFCGSLRCRVGFGSGLFFKCCLSLFRLPALLFFLSPTALVVLLPLCLLLLPLLLTVIRRWAWCLRSFLCCSGLGRFFLSSTLLLFLLLLPL
mmetsp:Transcript_96396/g.171356  ORF Transcript_96396/g.171356 Transcript_96396/m.171356 type:complete len:224 (+) Transcript_96396:563-1234(+)